jgi:hypothetical protein
MVMVYNPDELHHVDGFQCSKYHIYSDIRRKFFPDSSSKKWGMSYNFAQSSKNRANAFVISNTMKICLGWVVQLFRCVIFFLFCHVPRNLMYGNVREQVNVFFSTSTVECF